MELNSTKILLINGLTKYLKVDSLRDMTIQDILEYSEISRRSFYKYFKSKKEFVIYLEDCLIDELKKSLKKDREVLIEKLPKKPSTKDIFTLSEFAFKNTLNYCKEYAEIGAGLLSDNGDIRFDHEIRRVS